MVRVETTSDYEELFTVAYFKLLLHKLRFIGEIKFKMCLLWYIKRKAN